MAASRAISSGTRREARSAATFRRSNACHRPTAVGTGIPRRGVKVEAQQAPAGGEAGRRVAGVGPIQPVAVAVEARLAGGGDVNGVQPRLDEDIQL